jgi:hypothetical protein
MSEQLRQSTFAAAKTLEPASKPATQTPGTALRCRFICELVENYCRKLKLCSELGDIEMS